MKILFYAPASTGGHAEYTHELLHGLAQHKPGDWELHLVTRQGLAPEFRSSAWRIHEALPAFKARPQFSSRAAWAASRLSYNMREVRALRELLRGEHWDVVHFQEVSPFFHRRLLRQQRGATRFVYTVHNIQPHHRLAAGLASAYDRLSAAVWSRFDALVFHSERLKHSAARLLGNNANTHLSVIPHGIWSVPRRVRGLDAVVRPVRLLFLGVLRRNKGLHLLLDAMVRNPAAELTVAGAITDQAYFNQEIAPRLTRLAQAGTRVATEFAFIPKSRMIDYLQQSDYLVLPYSDFESQSGMLMYAVACGVPVIASDVGALGETVKQHGLGTTYSPATSAALREALRHTSVEESVALGENVRRYAGAHAWPNVAAQHCALYRAITHSGTVANHAATAGAFVP